MRLPYHCIAIFLIASALCAASALPAQTTPSATEMATPPPPQYNGAMRPPLNPKPKTHNGPAPFSRFAVGVGVSAMGINMQAAVNANRYMNLRGVGNFFNYSRSGISLSGFTVSGTANFASAGAAIDFYPFPNHGLRISPGALFYNQNAVSATMVATGGTSFTLNSATYYSSPSNPVAGVGSLNLHVQNPAPSLTGGWGNLIPRRGGHWSFPFEVGAAYIGAPVPVIAFTGGQVCSNAQGTAGCQNVVGDTTLNANLQAQIAKYQHDLQPLRFYPIVSFGVGFSFPIR